MQQASVYLQKRLAVVQQASVYLQKHLAVVQQASVCLQKRLAVMQQASVWSRKVQHIVPTHLFYKPASSNSYRLGFDSKNLPFPSIFQICCQLSG